MAANAFSLLEGDENWEPSKKSKKKNKKKAAASAEAPAAAPAAPAAKPAKPVAQAAASASASGSGYSNGFVPVTKKGRNTGGAGGEPRAQAPASSYAAAAPMASSNGRSANNNTINHTLDAVAVAEDLARTTTDEAGRVRLWRDWARQVRVACVFRSGACTRRQREPVCTHHARGPRKKKQKKLRSHGIALSPFIYPTDASFFIHNRCAMKRSRSRRATPPPPASPR